MATEFNNGDISELILAAAIAAKFKKRLSAAKLSREQIISIGDLPRVTSGEVKETLITIISNSFRSQFNVRDRDIVNKRISRVIKKKQGLSSIIFNCCSSKRFY